MSPGWLIGGISLLAKPDDNRAFWLDPAWQGQRLMSEASAGVADFWFERLGRPVLRVQKAAANRIAAPSSQWTCTTYSLPVSTGAP
jgi:[ribosomal protein S5]-alanine N-acetyltransferase